MLYFKHISHFFTRHNHQINFVKKIFLDPYFISTIFFTIWMIFLDHQNVFVQYKLHKRWQQLQNSVINYNIDIQRIKKEKKELVDNLDFLEKIAREKYYMKRHQEDLYIIVPK